MKKCKFLGAEFKNSSIYGNPSYWVYFTDDEDNFYKAYTASNSAAGYGISGHREGQEIYLKYHFTRTGNCIIDKIKEV